MLPSDFYFRLRIWGRANQLTHLEIVLAHSTEKCVGSCHWSLTFMLFSLLKYRGSAFLKICLLAIIEKWPFNLGSLHINCRVFPSCASCIAFLVYCAVLLLSREGTAPQFACETTVLSCKLRARPWIDLFFFLFSLLGFLSRASLCAMLRSVCSPVALLWTE